MRYRIHREKPRFAGVTTLPSFPLELAGSGPTGRTEWPCITEKMQSEVQLELPVGNFLSGLSIGDPIAENELQSLGRYYIRTDQFGRASRGEVNLIVGRKGSGKTALFSQLRDEKGRDKANVIVDLKPEGYQLIRLKGHCPGSLNKLGL